MASSIVAPVWGRWSRQDVRMDQNSIRVTAQKGEFLVLSKVARRRGKHRWQILIQKKTPGKPLSIGIGIDIEDKELTTGAQDTLFANRIWHYCNADGTIRNGAQQVKNMKTKQAYGSGDLIDVYFDADSGEISFARNEKHLEGSIVTDVVHTTFLEAQRKAREAGEPVEEGVGRFYLVVSLSAGDQVRLEDAPCELRYSDREGRYPWWSEIEPNRPVFDSGTWPMRFELSRPLPSGLNLDEHTGVITGTPTGINSLNISAWRDLCYQMYRGRIGEQGWKKARMALVKVLGIGLDASAIKVRAAELFARYDTDGSGEIDFSELKSAMESLKVVLTDVELMSMAADLDVDGNAEIGLVEFEEMLCRMYTSKDNYGTWKLASNALVRKLGEGLDVELELPRKCRDIFNEYDTDGSGYIDLGELEMAMHSLGIEVDSQMVVEMIDEAGIDQGEGDNVGIDFASWLELLKSMYTGSDKSIWEVAKAGIVKMIGQNLSDDELFERTDQVFKELDTDGSGELDMQELSIAMKDIGVDVLDDELSRMLEECDVNGRLWTVTAINHLGECKYLLKVIVVEGASELGYASSDVFCGIHQKLHPLKVAYLRGARPFKFSIEPALPEGMKIDEDTGTIQGRPLVELVKTTFVITGANEVNSTQTMIELQVLIPPSTLEYTYPSVIYMAGKLEFAGWMMARTAFIGKFGKRLTDDSLTSMARELFQQYDEDGSGAIDAQELQKALTSWEVDVSVEDVKGMIMEAKNEDDDGEEIKIEAFEKIVKQMFYGYKEGTDLFKTDPVGEWVDNKNTVSTIDGSEPFVYAMHNDQKLPKGLLLDRSTGVIHGVPSEEHYAQDFVIKASNRVGSVIYAVKIEVLDPPVNLVYRENCQNSKIGLHREFYPFRCTVNGTSNALCGHMRFTVGRDPVQTRKAFDEFDRDGSGELDAEEFRQMLVLLGLAISDDETAQMMSNMGKDPEKGAVTFADFWKHFNTGLPKGLEINQTNGEITGIPIAETPTSMYVITCWNPVGETSTTIVIEVQEAPNNFQYRFTDCLFKLGLPFGFERLAPEKVDPLTLYECGTEFATNKLVWQGSKVSFSIHPPLPEGLMFDEKNATISGTPTQLTTKTGEMGVTESRKYEITGRNEVGKSTICIWIEVSKVPSVLRYFKHELVYSMGEEVRDNEVILCDGTRPIRYRAQRDPVFARQIFNEFDVDQGGSLDREEFRSCLRDLGEKFSDKEFRWILSQVDTDKSGVIEYEEFWEFWKPLPFGLEVDDKSGTLYGRPLRQCEPGNFEVTVFNKVGSFSTMLNINVLDESLSRERDADRRRQFWYVGARKMLYPNGEKYDGGWKGGKWDGIGVYTKPDGYRYEGGWKRGRRHGACEETLPDGFWYKGEYMDGMRQGKGHLKWPNGDEYVGEFAEGKREGDGCQTWKMANGELYSYEGRWLNDLQHGEGIVTEKGERCEVQSKYGSILLQRPGKRVVQEFDFQDGSFYQGESAVTGTPGVYNLHGKGYKTWENGDTYEGEFYNGERHGWGIFSWANGDRYEGGWFHGKFNGHGVYKERGKSCAVWHEKGECQSRAPIARIPVTVADENFTGMSMRGKMLSYYGEAGYGQEKAGFDKPYEDTSVLPGHRDGTDFFAAYQKQLRTGTVLQLLPDVRRRGQKEIHKSTSEIDVLPKTRPKDKLEPLESAGQTKRGRAIKFDHATSDVKWMQVGPARPRSGNEINNSALREALKQKSKFTHAEIGRFGLSNLPRKSFIKVDNFYFKLASL